MESKVGFLGGMDRDSSLNKRDPNKYYDALNIRVLTDDGLSTGSVINEKGNKLIFKLPPTLPATTEVSTTSDFKIIGLGTMRDWIVIFTTDINPISTTGNGQIWKCKYNKVTELIENLDINGALDPLIHLVYNNVLGFNADYRVGEVISRYQDTTHGKIYFIDGLNTLKHINILDPNSLTLPLSSINIVSDVVFSQPKITKVLKGGALKSGAIQYSYQLFNEGGSETTFAPASGIVHLTDKNEYSNNTLDYKGAASDISVGKSVKIYIDNIDTTFDYIRLISVYYTSQEGQPEISIIEEKIIPSGGSIEFTDDGNPIGVYSTTEYNSTGSREFIPGTITTKNNYLIAANIKEQYFDVDESGYWDARAYRWYNNGFKIDGTVITPGLIPVPTILSAISETANCVLTRADQELYKYTEGSTRLGGTGLNISYGFVIKQLKLDSSNSDSTSSSTGIDPIVQLWNSRLDNTFANNNSYTSYASPINREQLVGYTRDEIYRFGIVFYDNKGRQSFAKWIADIKMPSVIDLDNINTYKENGGLYNDFKTFINQTSDDFDLDGAALYTGIHANVLGIEFTVSSLPANAVAYKIVRVRREDADKYILGQGLMGVAVEDGDPNTVKPLHLSTVDTCHEYLQSDKYPEIITFKSPEVLFTNSISPLQGDLVEIVGYTSGISSVIGTIGGYYSPDNMQFHKITTLALPASKITATISDGIKATDKWKENQNYKYVISNGGSRSRFLNHTSSYKGSSLVLGLDNALSVSDTANGIILNYTKDPSLVQYGGSSYTDRVNNTYISCGNLNSGIVFGGDTFIGIFEYLNSMWNTDLAAYGDGALDDITEIVFIPLESGINTELSNGSSINKGDATGNFCETVALGTSIYPGENDLWGVYPADYTDMYQYNTAYSAEPIGKTYSIKPQFFVNNQVNDYRVIVSEKHVNNQLTDSWTKFLYNNMIEVNSAYGSINKIITFRNRLFFFQDNAFGILGFEDRQLLKDNTGLPLTLGTGGILTNFQYISEKTGTKSKHGVVDTGNFLYFVDLNNKKFMRFDGNTDQCISDKDNMSSFFRTFDYSNILLDNNSAANGIHGVFDPINKRVLYTMLGGDNETFSFNEVLDNFESFYSFKPTIYENTDFGVISIDPSNLGECYLHNAGLRGVWYGNSHDSYITHVIAPNPDVKKVFNNIEFNSYVEINSVDYPNDTISDIKIWDSYQIIPKTTLTPPTNIRRRFRTWRYQIPKVNSLRFSDYHIFIKMYFSNDDFINKYFRLDNITMHYLVPMI